MKTVNFETSLGTIPVTGLAESFQRASRPAVLAITGLFAPEVMMENFPLLGGDATHGRDLWDGFLAALPGNRTAYLSETSIDAWARAFDEVVDQMRRPVVICGLSTAGLVSFAMKQSSAIVAVEPLLSTAKLWPLLPTLRLKIGTEHSDMLDKIFGVSAHGEVDRTYLHLVDNLAVPTEVLVGDAPLYPERPIAKLPSLLDDGDRKYLAACPFITLTTVAGSGHGLWWAAPRAVLSRVYRAVCAIMC